MNDGSLEYNIAVIFGVPWLAPLGMMPKGQIVGGGEGDMQHVLPRVSKLKNSPKSDLKWGGERVLHRQSLSRRSQERRTVPHGPGRRLCRCGRACVRVHFVGASGRFRSSSPRRLSRATEGRGKVLGSRFCREGISYWPACSSTLAPARAGRFFHQPGGFACSLRKNK